MVSLEHYILHIQWNVLVTPIYLILRTSGLCFIFNLALVYRRKEIVCREYNVKQKFSFLPKCCISTEFNFICNTTIKVQLFGTTVLLLELNRGFNGNCIELKYLVSIQYFFFVGIFGLPEISPLRARRRETDGPPFSSPPSRPGYTSLHHLHTAQYTVSTPAYTTCIQHSTYTVSTPAYTTCTQHSTQLIHQLTPPAHITVHS